MRVRLECLQARACRSRVVIRTRGAWRLPGGRRGRRPLTLARGRVVVPAGGSRDVVLRLLRSGRKLARRAGRVPVWVQVHGRGADGRRAYTARAATIVVR
jgi:hypothetical protein